jgi:hypothetical protein
VLINRQLREFIKSTVLSWLVRERLDMQGLSAILAVGYEEC